MESCYLCFCPFYQFCQLLPQSILDKNGIKGYWLPLPKGGQVWACEFCGWNHRQDVADYFKDNINRPRHEVFKECLERFGGK